MKKKNSAVNCHKWTNPIYSFNNQHEEKNKPDFVHPYECGNHSSTCLITKTL